MRVWIFSDLHLTNSESPLYQSLLEVLREPSDGNDCVVFSGDLFDLLVGNSSYFKRKFSLFFDSLQALTKKGVRVFYIEGNHDFNLSSLFPKKVRFEEEAVILQDERAFKRIYIAHGDLVDESDEEYLKLRRFLRSRFARSLIHFLPGVLIEQVGFHYSRPDAQKIQDLPENWSEEQRRNLRSIYRNFAEGKLRQGFDYVILGHCHDLDEIKPFYFNMGYPPVHRQFLFYESFAQNGKELLKRRNFPGV